MLDRAGLAALGVDDTVIATRGTLDGVDALAFLARLPELAARWERHFGLSGGQVMPGGALSAVLACERLSDGRAVVLKLSAPHAQSALAEGAALAAWGGVGACELLACDDHGEALVLERIEPGAAVEPGDDQRDARAAAELLALLHRRTVAPGGDIPDAATALAWRFGRAHRWLDEGRAVAAVTRAELDEAVRNAGELQQGADRALCHGDFLDKNILLDRHGRWRAIDPMPCIGDSCLDAAFWALHHRPGVEVRERCDLVAGAAGLDRRRVWRWARAFAASEAALDIGPGRADGHLRTLRA